MPRICSASSLNTATEMGTSCSDCSRFCAVTTTSSSTSALCWAYAWGVAIPCLLFGLILIGTGIGVGTRTNGQVAEIEQIFQENPAAMVQKELPRMEKVNSNFKLTFTVFGALVAVGLIIHYFGGPNWGRGVGAALILISAIGLLVDGINTQNPSLRWI